MAISVDHATRIITIPQADLTLISGTLYELDTNVFRQNLKDFEDGEAGIVLPNTHRHNTEVTVAGTTFARTLEIINGFSIAFSPDTQYSVRLVGSNNNIFDVESGILQQNQVQVIANNSAGLISGTETFTAISNSEYLGAIWINSISGNDANNGKPNSPVATATAAKTLADSLGLATYHLRGSITLGSSHDQWSFIGDSAALNDIVNLNNVSVDESRFQGLQISGDALESNIEALFCELDNPGNLHGVFRQCGLINTFKIEAITTQTYVFQHCYSQVAGLSRPALDFTSSGVTHNVQFRNYTGGLNIRNMLNGNFSMDTPAGTIDLESTVTGGVAVIRGTGILIDNSGGTASVNTDGFVQAVELDELWKLQGLDIANPMTVTPTSRDAGASVAQTISGDGDTTTTVTRDP